MEPWRLTTARASALMERGELTSEEYVRGFLERISVRDPVVKAWSWVDPLATLAWARECDRAPRKGPLHGIPFGAKDVINTRELPTQHNSPLYEGHRPGEDANCVAVLRGSGAVLLGKTDTLEFASGGRKPLSRNPRNLAHTPGGSSSGSGAAVADGMAPLALGTQTGGSTIRPAAFCGVHAMKPTFGRISFEGVRHYSVHLDTIGLYGRCVADLRLLAHAYRLVDDPHVRPPPPDALTIGVCETPMWSQACADAQEALHQAATLMRRAGAKLVPFVLPQSFATLTDEQDVLMHEGGRAAFLPEYLRARHGLHADFIAKVENQRGIHPAQMRQVLDAVAARRTEFEQQMQPYDAVLTLSAPGEAPLGLTSQGAATFNRMWTALGVPCINLPGMTGHAGLPIGMQLVHQRYEDDRLLQVAEALSPLLCADGVAP
jgi:Asp-tRNA(Asn)/Glu-tRNA(Gln) amidotransferase A subunit family amidase